MNWLRRLFTKHTEVVKPKVHKKPVRLDKHNIEVMVEYYKSGHEPKELTEIFDVSLTTVYKHTRIKK